ncbi:aminotransferase class IV [Leifsonia sp. NPDC102414]|uniref:aminotransferase class IV n=1 Tax=Leifsonia sp. NPDC102414 TaxID=3364124 RepID=UPI0037F35E4B
MDARTTLFDWRDGELVGGERDGAAPGHTLDVADSFLVADGTVLALGLHRERFLDSVREQGFRDRTAAESFWDAAVAAIPRSGSWFPRFELATIRDAHLLRFRLRTAPALTESVVLATADDDHRRVPDIKGPDIERLGVLRERAQRAGADEAVILDNGLISDGTTTALLWWRGDTLATPPLTFAKVDSVAARTVRGVAAAMRIPVDEEAVTPAELDGAVVWAVNALHGIRAVTAWLDGPRVAQDAARTAAWRSRLAALARPI